MGRLKNKIYSYLFQFVSDRIKKELLREVTFQVSKRFLLEYNDPETMRQLIQSQRYKRAIRPVLYDVPEADNILIYAPHEDDETIGAGGTILKCVEHGKRVKTIYVTDGATSIKQTRQDTGIRKEEARKVWEYIGGEPPQFWDLPCRQIPLTEETAATMRKQIEENVTECIFVPFFLEPPLDHRRVNQLLLMAHRIKPLPEAIQIWSYQVSSMLCPNVMIDITKLIDKKDSINNIWESQNAFFNYAHYARGMAAYNSIYLPKEHNTSPQKRYVELFFVAHPEEYIGLINNYFESEPNGNK